MTMTPMTTTPTTMTSIARSPRCMLWLALALALSLLSSSLEAQIEKPAASPRGKITQKVGLVEVSVDYGRPGVKGRKIFGTLEPYGKVWRTGANASTKVTFAGEVEIEGQPVPAGTYGLYTIPGKRKWIVILSKNSQRWGAGGYDEAEDLLRFEVKPTALKDLRETLTIDFEAFHSGGADLTIAWEKTKIRIPIQVDRDAAIFAEIAARLGENAGGKEPSAQTYFDAGLFYFEKNHELPQAARWIDRAMELKPGAFWYVYSRAELALAMRDRKSAKQHASRALEMAKKSNSDFGYVAKCSMLLEKLK